MDHIAFYKNMLWQYGLQALKYLLPFLTIPYLTRVLGADDYAVYAYVLSFMTVILVVLEFGFKLSGTKLVADCLADTEKVSRVRGSIAQAKAILCIGMFGVVACIAVLIPLLRENFVYTIFMFWAFALRAMLPDFVFRGFENMGPLTTRYLVSRGFYVVGIFLFIHSPSDMILIPLVDFASGLVALAWSHISIKKLFGVGFVLCPIGRVFGDLKASAVYCFSNLSSTLFTGLATLVLGLVMTDQAQISYWALAMTTVSAVQALFDPIINSMYPHMIATKDYSFLKRVSLLALGPLIAGTALYVLMAPWLMLVLGGEEYVAGATVLVWISPLLPISFYTMMFGWPLLGAMGKVNQLTTTTVVASLLNIVLLASLAVSGFLTMPLLCFVRCFIEGFVCVMRIAVSAHYLRKIHG